MSSNTTSTGIMNIPNVTGTNTTSSATTVIDFSSSGDYVHKDVKTFGAEWKKFRTEFLGHLLKDVPSGIIKFEQIRKLDPRSGEVIVEMILIYTPDIPERTGVRNNIA